MEEIFTCPTCLYQFAYEKNLKRHLKSNSCGRSLSRKIKCPQFDCGKLFSRKEMLVNHIQAVHGLEIEVGKYYFSTLDGKVFNVWKREIEENSLCYYVKHSTVTLHDGSKRVHFDCHRSGFFNTQSHGKRKLKSQGSNKINAMCTSSMVLTERRNYIELLFKKTHFGHGTNIGKCNLNSEERAMLADKIAVGVPFETILDDIQNNVQDMCDVKNVNIKIDLSNIKRDYNWFEGRHHSSDYASVILWIKKMNQLNSDDPIIYYNLDKENFSMIIASNFQKQMLQQFGRNKICIDSTHSTNEYDLSLTTLVAVNKFGNGFPCAYFISQKKDMDTWKLFFTNLKNCVGVINSQVFMSDADPSFYNAWKAVMGEVQHRLICPWHIDQSWRRNIQSKIKGGEEKKLLVYKTLKVLHQEPKEVVFKQILQGLINDLMADKDTVEFGNYFNTFYINRYEQWAYCYQKPCGIITNMHLESIHKCIKYFYLRGKENKRLDKCLNALIKFTRDKIFERFTKLDKNMCSSKENSIENNHEKGKQISNIRKISENIWEVPSTTDSNIFYEVVKSKDICDFEHCDVQCRPCEVCIHTIVCECPYFWINDTICKHIHACCMWSGIEYSYNVDIVDEQQLSAISEAIESRDALSRQIEVDSLNQKLEEALGLLSSRYFNKHQLSLIGKKCDDLLFIMSGRKRKKGDIENNKPAKQLRSAKQKNVKKGVCLPNPNFNETQNLLQNHEVVVQHVFSDSDYLYE